jgi:hypothetical protein
MKNRGSLLCLHVSLGKWAESLYSYPQSANKLKHFFRVLIFSPPADLNQLPTDGETERKKRGEGIRTNRSDYPLIQAKSRSLLPALIDQNLAFSSFSPWSVVSMVLYRWPKRGYVDSVFKATTFKSL